MPFLTTFCPPPRRVLLLVFCIFAVACEDRERPSTSPAAPEAATSETTSFQTQLAENLSPRLDVRSPDPRVLLSLDAEGSFRPDEPITVTVHAHATLDASVADLRILFPEVEAGRMTGFGDGYWTPVDVPLPSHAAWQLGAMSTDQALTRITTVDIPAPGYYRVLAIMEAEPQGTDPVAWRVPDTSFADAWLFVTEEGGALTPTFERDRIPDGMLRQPGPFRSNGKAERSGPEEASAFGALFEMARNLLFTGHEIDVYVKHLEFNSGTYQYATDATFNGDLYSGDPLPENFVRHEEGLVGSDGHYTVDCEGTTYTWDVWAEFTDPEVYQNAVHGQDQIYGCTDSLSIIVPDPDYQAFVNLKDEAIPKVDAHLSQSRAQIEFKVSEYGCGDSNGKSNCYHDTEDVIEFARSNTCDNCYARSKYIAAHEYGHAIHHKSLGGLWPVSNCEDHDTDKISSYSCALLEGFADYLGAVGGLEDSPYDDFEDFDAGVSTDSVAAIEGHVAAMFTDLTDSIADGNDSTDYDGQYIGAVLTDCVTFIDENYYDMDAADQYVWCLENRVNQTVQGSEFPGRSIWDGAEEQATEPSGWDADDIRATWLQNIGN